MRVLFLMRHAGYVRNFESTLRLLCERGHHVHLAFQGHVKYAQLDPANIAQQLADAYPTFSFGDAGRRADGWALLAREVHLGLDYLRYLAPEYDQAPRLRERAERTAPPALLAKASRGQLASPSRRRLLAHWLRAMDRAIPPDPEIDAYLRLQRPDVLAVTPLIEPGSPQAEYLRSARALGIRTAYCAASWDNLTNKGLIHGHVDLVTVWNEAMKREAVSMHGVAARRVAVTGAAAFDHWFDWRVSTTREGFCGRVGLPADRPYVLYVCSSKFVAPDEVPFVRALLTKMRQSSGPLRDAGLLIRPHPQNAEQWERAHLNALAPAALFPAGGAAPVDAVSRSDYFDSIFHSAAVVGINTTAEIESAILGRPVHTVLAPEFQGTQEGTLHFHHLRQVNGGLLHVAPDLDGLTAALEDAVRAPRTDDARARRFVGAFVRPYGLDQPATPRMVEAFERLAAAPPPAPKGLPVWAPLLQRRLAARAAELERAAAVEPESYAARLARKGAKEQRRHARHKERQQRLQQKVRELEARRGDRREAESPTRQQKLEAMILDFHKMGDPDRRRLLRSIVDGFPQDMFIELWAANRPRRLDYDRADIFLRVTTKTETFRVKACAKEPFTIDWIHARIRGGDVLYDIGANVGAYSLVAASQPGGGARVYSFEASYANVSSLCANIAINGLAGQVTALPVALSGRTAMDVFHLRDAEPGGARHALGEDPPAEDGPTVFRQAVMVYRLDDLVEQFQLPLPNHIKLDVDGGELDVLRGAARTLASPQLRSLLVEVNTSLSDAVTDALARSGLRLESKIVKQNKAGEAVVWYGLFGRGGGPVEQRTAGEQTELTTN